MVLEDAIKKLFALLGDRCFQRGTLVLDVTRHMDWARRVLKSGKRRVVHGTHKVPYPSTPQVDVRLDVVLCGELKRSALVYLFRTWGRTYMFCKPETHPPVTVQHIKSAARRYLLKKTSGNKRIPSRREDEPRVNALVTRNKSLGFSNYPYRVGNEMFVSSNKVAAIVE
jgi:hypothetical protein